MRVLRLLLLLVITGLVLSACGDMEAPSSDLPRTTDAGITISVTEAEELLPLPGCHTYWSSQGKEPPPGACEEMMTVRHYTAGYGSVSVETSVVGDVRVDPLYDMDLITRNQADGISIVVMAPPPEAASIRLVDPAGETLDQAAPTGPLVALAGLATSVDVEALSNDGTVIAACPHDGVVIDDVTYPCTIAPGAETPVTTIPFTNNGTP